MDHQDLMPGASWFVACTSIKHFTRATISKTVKVW